LDLIMDKKNKKVTDEEISSIINDSIRQAVGSFTSGSEMQEQREAAINYYTQQPKGNLFPVGVSKVVTSDTMEIVDSYLAVISELMLSNGKIAKFNPSDPTQTVAAGLASELTNHCIFTKNNGWVELNTWIKGALLFKNSIIRWKWEEQTGTKIEEYENISVLEVDALLSEGNAEIVEIRVGEGVDPESGEETYEYVSIRKEIDKSKVALENIPPESFMINRDATSIATANFVGIQTEMTLSDLREMGFDVDDNIGEGVEASNFTFDYESSVRQSINEVQQNFHEDFMGTANREVVVTESWIKVDRDGDGVAELKRFITVGEEILLEEYADSIPLACLNPIEIPHAFYGMSIADATKSATEIKTTITRGMIENVYLSNYGRTLADPNTVDFRALQSPEPHQIIPTNGSPMSSVHTLVPAQLAPSTFSLLEYMNTEKEMATGMTRAAQGVNEKLFDSGNSAGKIAMVEQAAQKRISYVARRFAETGFKDLCKGVYSLILDNSESILRDYSYYNITPESLMDLENLTVDIDVGANSSANTQENMMMMAQQVMPMLYQSPESKGIINPKAPFTIARQLLESMGIDNWVDFLVDPDTEQGQQQKQAAMQEAQQSQEQAGKAEQVEQQKIMLQLQKQMADIQKKQADMELDREKFEYQKTKDAAELQLELALGEPTKIG
tara:strand:+ start:310 stop:2331 length:2022 start_codon:yes stop_codon:yes gene_type:complete